MDFDPSPGVANLIVTSSTPGIYLAKYDNNGNYLWAKAFDGIDGDQGFGIKTDNAGNVYLSGEFSETVDFDPSAGVANLTAINYWDAFLAKYDASGNYVWAIGVGSNSDDFGRPILIDSTGNVYFSGFFSGTADFDPSVATATLSSASGGNTFIAKYDALGNYIWAKNIGASRSYGFCFDQMGNICISGIFSGTGDFDPGPGTYPLTSTGLDDVFYGKYDVNGNLIWAKSFGGTSNDACFDLELDNGGNIYLTGGFKNTVDFDPGPGTSNVTATGTTYKNAYLVRYNSTGDFQWVKTFGSTGEDLGRGIATNSLGDIYLTSWFNNTVDFDPGTSIDNYTSNGGQDFALTKYSNPTTAIENAQELESNLFKLYPNPTNGILFCETLENTEIFMYNSNGELVLSLSLNTGKHTVDISSFSPDGYLIRSNISPQGMTVVKY